MWGMWVVHVVQVLWCVECEEVCVCVWLGAAWVESG